MENVKLNKLTKKYQQDSDEGQQPLSSSDLNRQMLDGEAIIHRVARYGDVSELKLLIEYGANLELKGDLGYTPLLEAISAGKVENVLYLISVGADINAKTVYDDSVIDLADRTNSKLHDLLVKIKNDTDQK